MAGGDRWGTRARSTTCSDGAAEVKAGLSGRRLDAAGHRVHGGLKCREPTPIDHRVLADLEELVPLAPIRALAELQPDLPRVACFASAAQRIAFPLACVGPTTPKSVETRPRLVLASRDGPIGPRTFYSFHFAFKLRDSRQILARTSRYPR